MTDTAAATGLVDANGVQLAYESFGHPADPTILLVMGLGTQLLAWPESLCRDLADAGHHVLRYDNRDVGLSTKFDGPAPTLAQMVTRRGTAYTIADMADDAFGLLAGLGIDAAHVVGASMGGFIAQTVAIRRPAAVRSLTLIMTSTGSRRVGQAHPKLLRRLLTRPVVTSREEAQDAVVDTFRVIGSKGFPLDEQRLRDLAGRSYDRAYDPGGYRRQLAAVVAQPDRSEQLRALDVPALVMHGLHDVARPVADAERATRLLPDAELHVLDCGHSPPFERPAEVNDLLRGLLERVAQRTKGS